MDFCQFLQCQAPCTNVKSPDEDLLATVLYWSNTTSSSGSRGRNPGQLPPKTSVEPPERRPFDIHAPRFWAYRITNRYQKIQKYPKPEVLKLSQSLSRWRWSLMLSPHLTSKSNTKNRGKDTTVFGKLIVVSRLCWRQRTLRIGFPFQFVPRFCLVGYALLWLCRL